MENDMAKILGHGELRQAHLPFQGDIKTATDFMSASQEMVIPASLRATKAIEQRGQNTHLLLDIVAPEDDVSWNSVNRIGKVCAKFTRKGLEKGDLLKENPVSVSPWDVRLPAYLCHGMTQLARHLWTDQLYLIRDSGNHKPSHAWRTINLIAHDCKVPEISSYTQYIASLSRKMNKWFSTDYNTAIARDQAFAQGVKTEVAQIYADPLPETEADRTEQLKRLDFIYQELISICKRYGVQWAAGHLPTCIPFMVEQIMKINPDSSTEIITKNPWL